MEDHQPTNTDQDQNLIANLQLSPAMALGVPCLRPWPWRAASWLRWFSLEHRSNWQMACSTFWLWQIGTCKSTGRKRSPCPLSLSLKVTTKLTSLHTQDRDRKKNFRPFHTSFEYGSHKNGRLLRVSLPDERYPWRPQHERFMHRRFTGRKQTCAQQPPMKPKAPTEHATERLPWRLLGSVPVV